MTHRPGLPVAAGSSVDPFLVSAIGVVLVIAWRFRFTPSCLATCVLTLSYARPMYRGMKVRLWLRQSDRYRPIRPIRAGIDRCARALLAGIFGDLLPTTVAMPICFWGRLSVCKLCSSGFESGGRWNKSTISRRLRAQESRLKFAAGGSTISGFRIRRRSTASKSSTRDRGRHRHAAVSFRIVACVTRRLDGIADSARPTAVGGTARGCRTRRRVVFSAAVACDHPFKDDVRLGIDAGGCTRRGIEHDVGSVPGRSIVVSCQRSGNMACGNFASCGTRARRGLGCGRRN